MHNQAFSQGTLSWGLRKNWSLSHLSLFQPSVFRITVLSPIKQHFQFQPAVLLETIRYLWVMIIIGVVYFLLECRCPPFQPWNQLRPGISFFTTLSEKNVIIIWSICIEWVFSVFYILVDLRQEITLKFYVAGLLIDLNCLFLSRYKAFNKQCVLHNLNSCSNFHSRSLNNEVIFKVEVEDTIKLFFQSRFSSACRLMRILRLHLKFYLAECS